MKGTIHHIEINVSSLEKSRQFWGWLLNELGYIVHQQWDMGISYKLDHTYLVFVQTKSKHLFMDYHRGRTGLNHIAFHVDSVEELNKVTKQLKEKHIAILYPEKYPSDKHHAVYFEDPDRVKVEIVAD